MRNNTLTFFYKLELYYDSQLDRYKADLSVTQNTISTKYINRPFYYSINTIVYTRGLNYLYNQKLKLKIELASIRRDKDYIRPYYTSLFIYTIGIDCLYILEGVDTILAKAFDKFQIILGTTNSILLLVRRRLLKLVQRLRKRNTRIARSYAAGIGTTIGRCKAIGAELNNLNNTYLLNDDSSNEAT